MFCASDYVIWHCVMIPTGSILVWCGHKRWQQTLYFSLLKVKPSDNWDMGEGYLSLNFAQSLSSLLYFPPVFMAWLVCYKSLWIILLMSGYVLLISHWSQFVWCTLHASNTMQRCTNVNHSYPYKWCSCPAWPCLESFIYHQHNLFTPSTNTTLLASSPCCCINSKGR